MYIYILYVYIYVFFFFNREGTPSLTSAFKEHSTYDYSFIRQPFHVTHTSVKGRVELFFLSETSNSSSRSWPFV